MKKQNKFPKPHEKSFNTAKWAKIMAKWDIKFSSKGKIWQIVAFEGKKGGESRGIVDLLAIRRDHHYKKKPLKIGDLFEIILIQVKGGNARRPSLSDIERLNKVGKYYNAKHIILVEWKKSKVRDFYELKNKKWLKVNPKEIFN